MAAYDHDHVKYPHSGADILKAQEEAREALFACGWWQQGDEDSTLAAEYYFELALEEAEHMAEKENADA